MTDSSDSKRNYKYTPDFGTFAEEGKTYEKHATAFITLRCLNTMDNFYLISNPLKCAPFDDVILCSTTKNRNIIYLFQIKHKLNPTHILDGEFACETFNNKKSKFSLYALYKKYPKSVEEIRKIIPQNYIKSSFLVIFYTNRSLQENSDIFELTTETMFSTTDGKAYKLKQNFIIQHHDSYKRSFLQSIVVYSTQHDINNASIAHVKRYFNTEDNIAEAITYDYFGCIQNWCGIISERDGLTKIFIYKLLMFATFKNFSVLIDDYEEAAYKKYQAFLEEKDGQIYVKDEEVKEFLDLLWKLVKG